MPITINPGEKKKEFLSRCIATEVEAGKPQNQAIAICSRVWDSKHKVKKEDRVKLVKPFEGLNICLEWLDGETRQWEGCPYRNPMIGTNYGFVKDTIDGDGEGVDVYLSSPIHENTPVFMMSQLSKEDGTFDEHKFFLGFKTQRDAELAYQNAMPKEMMGDFDEMTMEDFKNKILHFHWRDRMNRITKAKEQLKDLIWKAEQEEAVAKFGPELNVVMKGKIVMGFESPEPGDLSRKGADLLAKVYATCRRDGVEKDNSARIAWDAVKHAGFRPGGRKAILKKLESLVQRMVELHKSRKVTKAGAPPGTRSQRKDGIFEKQADGKWVKIAEPGQKPKEKPEAKPKESEGEPLTDNKLDMSMSVLLNDETSSDEQIVDFLKTNGLTDNQAKTVVSHRDEALRLVDPDSEGDIRDKIQGDLSGGMLSGGKPEAEKPKETAPQLENIDDATDEQLSNFLEQNRGKTISSGERDFQIGQEVELKGREEGFEKFVDVVADAGGGHVMTFDPSDESFDTFRVADLK